MADPIFIQPFPEVTTTITSAATLALSGKTRGEIKELCFSVENSGVTNALTAAVLQVRTQQGGTFHTLISDWSTVSILMKFCSTALTTLAAEALSTCYVEIPPCAEWRLMLTSASGTTAVCSGFGR